VRYPLLPIPETVTVRPALAASFSGLTPFELMAAAMSNDVDNPAIIRATRAGNMTEYRLDDILSLLGTMTAVRRDDEEPP
jgi:hypothetical protein